TNLLVKLLLAAGHAVLVGAQRPLDAVPTVFASSGGDGEVINDICTTLAGEERQVSPTRFHNSVHNAPSGYWGIATQSREPSVSLCGYEWSFVTGLLEAAAQVVAGKEEILLITGDTPYPEPLGNVRRVSAPFGAAFLFTRERTARSMAKLSLRLEPEDGNVTRMPDPALEQLRNGNPCARSLPLLAALAARSTCDVVLEREFQGAARISVAAA
ncbi:MAG TPA: beta-ketoacyl synthase chain length factor, partial [Burkholderiales bacterium]|nr:beta-ketoacyl synthase chain length factor [Burkholderiales bacterium]